MDLEDFDGMVPYLTIFPRAKEGVFGLTLSVKVGKAKAGEYLFVESYCIEKDCDCRRTTVFVIDKEGTTGAAIDFGFDPDQSFAGPFLSDFDQPAVAWDLLEIFVDLINDNPAWLSGMYKRYRKVRRRVDGRAYDGAAFPKPGRIRREIEEPEPWDEMRANSLEKSSRAAGPAPRDRKTGNARQLDLFASSLQTEDLAGFIELYRQLPRDEEFSSHRALQQGIRHYLLNHAEAGAEMAALLVRYFSEGQEDEAGFDAALRLLFDSMEILRTELDRRDPAAEKRMARWQNALAEQIFTGSAPDELCMAVTNILLQTRVEILPQLHEAGRQRIMAQGERLQSEGILPFGGQFDLPGLFRSLEELELESPFELLNALLELTAVGDADIETALGREMLGAPSQLIRDTAALMLFHPLARVREGMAQQLASVAGDLLSPATLRRLIVSRNWFPEPIRANIDQAIAHARQARVECAPMPAAEAKLTVQASVIDGAGAQTFQVIVPEGKGFLSCSILLKEGTGVADAFMVPLENKRDRKKFLAMLEEGTGAQESTLEYLDLRLCQALAEGTDLGKAPPAELVAIAERLGREQWQPLPFEPLRELAALGEFLARTAPGQLTEKVVEEALEDSGEWHMFAPFAFSWFEDSPEVDRTIAAAATRKDLDPAKAIKRLLDRMLVKRRRVWLKRLVLTTLWLKSARQRPQVSWIGMYHVANAVADEGTPLKDIPLMVSIADATLEAYLARLFESGDDLP